jgi:hypothetical protein
MAGTDIVVLIHGIRTEATWGELVKTRLERAGGLHVEILRYGYFDLLRFLSPFGTRRGAVTEIEYKIQAIRNYDRDSDISIIAHSFGTYIVAAILKRDDFFRAKRIVFCGSVVPRRFNWFRVAHKIKEPKIVNDCGTSDIWPVLARAVTFGYGPTGTFGFGDPKVRDRYHPFAHSDYFDATFVDTFWVPYILTGRIEPSTWDVTRPSAPWWMSILAWMPSRWVIWCTPLVWVAYRALGRLDGTGLGLRQLLTDVHRYLPF